MKKEWKDCNYWEVCDTDDIDKRLFTGSKSACVKWRKKNGGRLCNVIMELVEVKNTKGTKK